MKRLLIVLLFICPYIVAQNSEYEIYLTDKNGEWTFIDILTIDSIIQLSPSNTLESNDTVIFNVALPEGKHAIKAYLGGYKMLDSIISFSEDKPKHHLTIDMTKDFHLYEFQEGFEKIYPEKNITIGLKKDSTFLIRSFFHISLVGCFQFEKGKYRIEENKLILDVENYHAPCFKTKAEIRHRYTYTLENDKIIDPDKYFGFIEKTYMGVGAKEYD